MSDPLSISTAVVTFIGAALTTTREILAIAHGISQAKQDIINLVKELEDLKDVLKNLKNLHELIGRSDTKQLEESGLAPETLQLFNHDLIELKSLVRELESQLRGSTFQRVKAKYSFALRKKAHVASLAQKIETSKSSLNLALSVFQVFQSENMRKQLKSSGTALTDLAESSATTNDGVERIQQSLTFTNGGVESIQASVTRTHFDVDQIKHSLIAIDQRTKGTELHHPHFRTNGICHIIPYPRNDRFVGRIDILYQIESALLPTDAGSKRMTSFALHGMPGVGKTQTALQFVYLKKDRFPAIFWISASSVEKIILGYMEIARELGLTGKATSADQAESVNSVKNWFGYTDVRWLLIFNNVDNIGDLATFWPSGRKGSVLVTSQNSSSEHTLANKGSAIAPFSPHEGIELLKSLSQSISKSITDEEAAQVAQTLGHHPLAINQMASFIIESGCSIPSFLEMYARREEANELQGVNCECPWYANTVAVAFDLSIARLSSSASSLLDTLSFFDPDRIPGDVLSFNPDGIDSTVGRLVAIKELRKQALLNNTETHSIFLHRLVRDAVLRRLNSSVDETQKAFGSALSLLRKAFPLHGLARDHMTEYWHQCETYLSHVLSFHDRYKEMKSSHIKEVSVDFVELIYSCAWYLCERGRFDISSELIDSASNAYHSLKSRENELLWADICTVKLFYVNETHHQQTAIALAKEALDIREKAVRDGIFDEDHPNRANGFMNLGVMYAKIDPQEAIRHHIRAIGIRERSSRYKNDQVHGLALNYLNIGRSFWMVGQLDEAAESFEKCLTIIQPREEVCGFRFALSAWALDALGNVQIDRGELESALILYTESMELNESILGSIHLKIAASYYKVAWLLWKRGELTRAIDVLKLALSVYRERLGDLRAERARSKYLLSQILRDAQGDNSEEWKKELRAAQILKCELTGQNDETSDTQDSYDELVPYFYR